MNNTSPSARLRPPRRLLKKLLLVFAGLAIALLLAEGALRVLGFSHFIPYIVDKDVGFSLRPNAEGWWRKEGLTYVRINSQGLRDREHTIAKPRDTIRIAVLGDSFAEAFQVPMEKTFWTVMEQKLQACVASSETSATVAARKIEVLNFGVSGFSTARELILLRQRVWQYDPDLVLLLVTTRNDVRDNSRALDPYASSALPYFVYREGSLHLDDSRLQARNSSLSFRVQQSLAGRALNQLRFHSRLVGLLDAVREMYQWRNTPTVKHASSSGEPGLDDEVFRAPANSDWVEAWTVTEKLVLQMRDEVRARSAKFLVVTGSTGIQVSPDASLRAAYTKQLGVDNLFYPDMRFKALGDREGFEVITLAPLLLEYATRNQVVLHGSGETQGKGHWNESGHRVVGELIAQKLCQPGWLQTNR
ncbi:MAG: hypothetical protein QOF62_1866 [Pyrinomonadaceae bacterium]|nr:hypothetical protein [Pyrinomonadaceae bacterium]